MVNYEKQYEYYALKLVSAGKNKSAICQEIKNIKNCNSSTANEIIDIRNSIITYTSDENTVNTWKETLEALGASIKVDKIYSNLTLEEQLLTLKKRSFIVMGLKVLFLIAAFVLVMYLYNNPKANFLNYCILFSLFIFRYFTCILPDRNDNLIKIIFNTCICLLCIWEPLAPNPTSIQIGLLYYMGIFMPFLDIFLFITRKRNGKKLSLIGVLINSCAIFFLGVLFIMTFSGIISPGEYSEEAIAKREAIEKQEALEKERQAQEMALKTINGIAFRALSKQYTSEAGLQFYGVISTGNSLVLQVNVEIRNEGKSSYQLNKIGAILVDNNGAEYDGAILTNALDMLNASQNILNPGMSTTKMLFFKIPEKKDYTLKLYDGGIFSDPVIIKL